MRIDKYLKVSRVVKRRTVANEVCSAGRVLINDKVAKPGTEVKVGDIVTIKFGNGETRFKILTIKETVRKEEASEMYELLEGTEVE
ncbi:MAG: RNA-binding S4 domain-containing protein [Clostridiales bacterium]|nr:RNA-binding S4 domain-containing protein [Clostridiales bacterium]MBO4747724.1 RNA-binding S4 domain-containing protein [Clostridiales bacterium]MBR4819848.1 RNA-binding S4 domain-containing protein [Clostridiales bacterium]MBR5057307.1 RNA-binding S4 domain-containing protein [Clostridiales bacterium]